MAKTLRDWLQEGEVMYEAAVQEFHSLEVELAELEQRLAEKRHEANQFAQVLGKPLVEGRPRLTAELVEERGLNGGDNAPPDAPSVIVRAIQGRLAR